MPTNPTDPRVYLPADQLLGLLAWPLSSLAPAVLGQIGFSDMSYDATSGKFTTSLLLVDQVEISIPGVDGVTLQFGPAGGLACDITITRQPLSISFAVPVTAVFAQSLLVPVATAANPNPSPTLALSLGSVTLTIDANGEVSFTLPNAVSLPACQVAATGVVVQADSIGWLNPTLAQAAPGAPSNFSGFYIQNGSLTVPAYNLTVKVPYVFIGTGGVTLKVTASQKATFDGHGFATQADGSGSDLIPPLSLFGDSPDTSFQAVLTSVSIAITQNSFTDLTITGNVFVPYVDAVVGITLGLDAAGKATVQATSSLNACQLLGEAVGAVAATDGHLFELSDLFDGVLTLGVDALSFSHPPGGAPMVSISGEARLSLAEITQGVGLPSFGFKGLTIDAKGNIAIDGGWIDLDAVSSNSFASFPFDVSKIGFGTDSQGPWVGLYGGLKMVDGLPLGVSVSGLKIHRGGALSLSGIGLDVSVPGAFSFSGSADFFSGNNISGFRASLSLVLEPLQIEIDASMVVGVDNGTRFLYLFLEVDLPVAIPIFQTGVGIYGFAGLVAVNMAPSRQPDQDWYAGWYMGAPVGVTDGAKWAPAPGAFAVGLGTVVGTAADDGFSSSVKALLVVCLPGPTVILQGKANFLSLRPGTTDVSAQGTLEALVIFDGADSLFQADIAATYQIPALLNVGGGAEVAASWADHADTAKYWHFFLGQDTPKSAELHAVLLSLFNANAYLMVNRLGMKVGGEMSYGQKFDFGVAKAWVQADLHGWSNVSFKPPQFDGQLTLGGTAGMEAFGVGISIVLSGGVEAQGPKPWKVVIDVQMTIKVDLLVKTLKYTADLPLSWIQDLPPSPASPVLSSGAYDHLLARDPVALTFADLPLANPAAATVPPDGCPVLVFTRPVGDLAGAGQAASTVSPDQVGKTSFAYDLGHVLLFKSGGQDLVAAVGFGTVSGQTLTPAGLSHLPDQTACSVTIDQGAPLAASVSGGVIHLTISPAAGDGTHRYSLTKPQAQESVTIVNVAVLGSTADVTVSGLVAAAQVYAGGQLFVGNAKWDLLGGTGNVLTLAVPGAPPATGPATLLAPPPAVLQGMWLANDASNQNAQVPPESGGANQPGTSMTQLMLWADTPFAVFQNNVGIDQPGSGLTDPAYACGPTPVEDYFCIDFSSLPDGPVARTFWVLSVQGNFVSGSVSVVSGRKGRKWIQLTQTVSGAPYANFKTPGAVGFDLGGPVDRAVVEVGLELGGTGTVTGWRNGNPGTAVNLVPGQLRFVPLFSVDQIAVQGDGVRVFGICMLPGWTVCTFDAASFPQGSTGEQSYAGLQWSSPGVMSVVGGVLDVTSFLRYRPAPATLAAPAPTLPAITLPGLPGGTRLELPLIGPATVSSPPRPASGRALRTPVLLPRRPPVPMIPATLTILLPQPVTRVAVALGSAATVSAFAGTRLIQSQAGVAGDYVVLIAPPTEGPDNPGWIDRVNVSGYPAPLVINTFSYDAGAFAWTRFQQWQWQQSVREAVSSLYQDSQVLPPGTYELDVWTRTTTTDPSGAVSEAWSGKGAAFAVGRPPGLNNVGATVDPKAHYPNGGPLNDLATYVDRTLPANGARPFYRQLDTAVSFKTDYVSLMYLQAGSPLSLNVLDPNGKLERTDAQNVWGKAPQLYLSKSAQGFIQTLQGDGSCPCATVNLDEVVLPEAVSAGGTLLSPAQLHHTELDATPPVTAGQTPAAVRLFTTDFVTSRFANLRQHLSTFPGTAREGVPADLSQVLIAADGVSSPVQTFLAAVTANAQAYQGDDLAARTAAATALASAAADLATAQGAAFGAMYQGAFGVAPPTGFAARVSLTRVRSTDGTRAVWLLESPEPLPWLRLNAGVSNLGRARRRVVLAVDPAFGSPDQGQAVAWSDTVSMTPSAELRLVQTTSLNYVGPLQPVTAAPGVSLVITVPTGASVAATVVVGANARVTFGPAAGRSRTPPVSHGPTTDAAGDLTANPARLTLANVPGPVALTGRGVFGLTALAVSTGYSPTVSTGNLRIVAVRLPASATDNSYSVDLGGLDAIDLNGWSIAWWDLTNPADQAESLVVFDAAAGTLPEGNQWRCYPARATPAADPDVDQVIVGGAGTPPPVTGAVFQLVDPSGNVAQEWVAAPVVAQQSLVAIPSADGTRAFLVRNSGAASSDLLAADGTVRLEFTMNLQGDGLPTWSIGGVSNPENAVLPVTF